MDLWFTEHQMTINQQKIVQIFWDQAFFPQQLDSGEKCVNPSAKQSKKIIKFMHVFQIQHERNTVVNS